MNLDDFFSKRDICFSKTVNLNKESFDVYIGRPTKWGNPFTHIDNGKTLAKYIVSSREEAIEKYEEWITTGEGKHLLDDLHELKNKTLGCWCKPKSCHGDVLNKLILKKYGNVK